MHLCLVFQDLLFVFQSLLCQGTIIHAVPPVSVPQIQLQQHAAPVTALSPPAVPCTCNCSFTTSCTCGDIHHACGWVLLLLLLQLQRLQGCTCILWDTSSCPCTECDWQLPFAAVSGDWG
ncbi:hypothetical protein COO60DRAFT_327155 [Scenedesmus sp. NREL 46B-D3]|nr:hypothetical protein COO60DRAFT_327155 [Scenedesmus sp. NREL 46B-D3]